MKNPCAVAFLMILILTMTFPPTNAAIAEDTYAGPNITATITIDLQSGQIVSGSFNVLGGNMGVDFWVRDPTGTIILNAGIVYHEGSFAFTAANNGAYVLSFHNRFSSGRSIHAVYDVSPPPLFGIDPVIFMAMILVVGAVLAILMFIFYRGRARRRTNQSSQPPSRACQQSIDRFDKSVVVLL